MWPRRDAAGFGGLVHLRHLTLADVHVHHLSFFSWAAYTGPLDAAAIYIPSWRGVG